jgi:hypothetical protein
VNTADLVRLDLLGPALAEATGDGRWRSLDATLIAGGKSNLTFEVTSEAGAGGGRLDGRQDFGNLDQEILRIAEGGLSRLEED